MARKDKYKMTSSDSPLRSCLYQCWMKMARKVNNRLPAVEQVNDNPKFKVSNPAAAGTE